MNNMEDNKNFFQDNNALQVEVMSDEEKKNKEKYEAFKHQLEAFQDIETIEEARELAEQIIPLSQEINELNIGSAKCIIVNRDDMLRISLDSDAEFISYDFE